MSVKIGKFWGKPDRDQLYRDLREFIEEFGTVSMGQVDVAETLQAIMEVMKSNKIGMPHGLTMLARGMAHMEGVLAAISPDINMIQIAATSVADTTLRDIDWKSELARSIRKGIDIPLLAADIMQEYLEGQARFNLKLETTPELELMVASAVRNLVIGMCIVALLIGSSILCLTDMQWRGDWSPSSCSHTCDLASPPLSSTKWPTSLATTTDHSSSPAMTTTHCSNS